MTEITQTMDPIPALYINYLSIILIIRLNTCLNICPALVNITLSILLNNLIIVRGIVFLTAFPSITQ